MSSLTSHRSPPSIALQLPVSPTVQKTMCSAADADGALGNGTWKCCGVHFVLPDPLQVTTRPGGGGVGSEDMRSRLH